MILSNEEVVELKVYLEQEHIKRMTEIEQYNQERNAIKEKLKVLKN